MYEVNCLGLKLTSSSKSLIRRSLVSLGEKAKHGSRFSEVSCKDIILNLKRFIVHNSLPFARGKSERVKHLANNKLCGSGDLPDVLCCMV